MSRRILALLTLILLAPFTPLRAQDETTAINETVENVEKYSREATHQTASLFQKYLEWYRANKGPVITGIEKGFTKLFNLVHDLTVDALNHLTGKDKTPVEEVMGRRLEEAGVTP